MSRAGKKLTDVLNEELGRRAIEGLSLHSLRAMRDAADSFLLSLSLSRSLSASSVTSAHIVVWIEGMRAKSLAPSTLLVRYRYLSVLMRGLVAVGPFVRAQ